VAVVGSRERAQSLAHLDRPPELSVGRRAVDVEAVLAKPRIELLRCVEPFSLVLTVDRVHELLDEPERSGRRLRDVVARHDTSIMLTPVSSNTLF
jgi:hypothetical protein